MAADLLSRVRSQDTAIRTLERAIGSERVHHAYLFAGPDGVGKELAAFGLAQALVCVARKSGQKRACGACSACTRALPRAEERTPLHPDVVVIERALYAPQAIGRRTVETQDISIDQVRTLVLARSAYAPHEGKAKVFVIRRAEELSISAANALLKTLEEPGQKTHFLLLTSQPDQLLPTILSRTLRVRFAPLPDEVVAEILAERGVDRARAQEVSLLAGGSVETAAMLADPEESEARDDFVERALQAAAAPGLAPSLALAEDAKKEKDRLPAYVAALAAALARRGADRAREGHPDAEILAARGRIALAAIEHLAGNGAAQLVVEAMMTRMRSL